MSLILLPDGKGAIDPYEMASAHIEYRGNQFLVKIIWKDSKKEPHFIPCESSEQAKIIIDTIVNATKLKTITINPGF